MTSEPHSLVPRQLSLPGVKTLPPSIPLVISSQDSWNPLSCQLETGKQDPNNHSLKLMDDALQLLRTIDKPLAILAICGPYRSGKSYFISRVLGSPGAFKLGHGMQACTRGIWMATTVLECFDFTTVLLDTEGIDAVGSSETMAMSLLTLTTLLSSFLIYNSKKVPMKMDLDRMRCFSQLSASLLTQCGGSRGVNTAFFPHFLWLLRDVNLKMLDRKGEELQPTEFLHTRLLASESGELTALGKSLVSLFPTLECATLPMPSLNPKILHDICNHQEKLSMKFNTEISALIQQILQKVNPKKGVNGTANVNGKVLAALAGGWVEAVDSPGTIPDLDQGWQAVVRLELHEYSYKLVREYEREMEEALEGKLPMEERKLLRIHQEALKRKKDVLRGEISRVNPLHSSDKETQSLLDKLEKDIVQWSKAKSNGQKEVTGGILYQFQAKNVSASEEQCEKLFKDIVKMTKVQENFHKAVEKSLPITIDNEVSDITVEYHKRAVGPAASQVLDRGLLELSQFSNILKKIPGQPKNVEVIGTSQDRVKLSWEPPAQNPEAVDEYIIYKRVKKGGNWEEAVKTGITYAVVKGLKSQTEYEFHVISNNSGASSLVAETKTNPSTVTSGFVMSACFGLALPVGLEIAVRDPSALDRISHSGAYLRACLCALTLPVSLLLSPVTAPVGAVVGAVDAATHNTTGDLSEESFKFYD